MVTGASRGIGRAIALALGGEGARVAVNYSASSGAAEEVAGLIREAGGEALTVRADMGKPDDIAALFKAVVEEWGGVDVLVNNAGAGQAIESPAQAGRHKPAAAERGYGQEALDERRSQSWPSSATACMTACMAVAHSHARLGSIRSKALPKRCMIVANDRDGPG